MSTTIDFWHAIFPLGSEWRMKSNGAICKVTRVTNSGLDVIVRLDCGPQWWHVYRTSLEMQQDFERL